MLVSLSIPHRGISQNFPANKVTRANEKPTINEGQRAALTALQSVKNPPKSNELVDGLKAAKEKANGFNRGMIQSRFQELTKRFNLLKKLGAGDPKIMMRELRAIAKEIKSLSKEYGDLLKAEKFAAGFTNSYIAEESKEAAEAETQSPNVAKQNYEAPPKDDFIEAVRIMLNESKHVFKILKARIEATKKDKEGQEIIEDSEKDLEAAFEEFNKTEEIKSDNSQPQIGQFVSISA